MTQPKTSKITDEMHIITELIIPHQADTDY